MKTKKKKRDWRAKLPKREEIEAHEAKEKLKQLESVNAKMRFIVPMNDNDNVGLAFEIGFNVTRRQLAQLQQAHADDSLMINWIQEDK